LPSNDIDITRVRIPKGAIMVLLVASGNRDPKRFNDPDRFDPDRKNNQNFGFSTRAWAPGWRGWKPRRLLHPGPLPTVGVFKTVERTTPA
jgi:hypothetical protein